MSKFARPAVRPAVTSPVTSSPVPDTVTHEGGTGFTRDPRSELFLLAAANMVGEDTFYETGTDRDTRFRDLVHAVTRLDPAWVARLVPYLRGVLNMRSAAVVVAAETVRARLDHGIDATPTGRQVIASALLRADEPAEMLAYWQSRYGRNLPQPVKRGIADAVQRLFTERAALKYDGTGKVWRFGDVIDLVHPEPVGPWQSALFRWLLDRRHGRTDARLDADLLPMVAARQALADMEREHGRDAVRAHLLADPARLQAAGLTWEALSGYGPMDGPAWVTVIPSMGTMALVRNLRNFDQPGSRIADDVAAAVAARIADPEQVKRSRMFPFRFLAAYRAAPSLRWGHALEQALTASLGNVPSLPGRTLVLVDRSGSMWFGKISNLSDMTYADAGAVFAAAVALRAERADLVRFGTNSQPVTFGRGDALLRVVERIGGDMGGTNTQAAVSAHYSGQDRVIIVTDEQAHDGRVFTAIPGNVPTYTWNLAGYRAGHDATGASNRHTFGGLSDAAFRLIPLLEAGRSASWDDLFDVPA